MKVPNTLLFNHNYLPDYFSFQNMNLSVSCCKALFRNSKHHYIIISLSLKLLCLSRSPQNGISRLQKISFSKQNPPKPITKSVTKSSQNKGRNFRQIGKSAISCNVIINNSYTYYWFAVNIAIVQLNRGLFIEFLLCETTYICVLILLHCDIRIA